MEGIWLSLAREAAMRITAIGLVLLGSIPPVDSAVAQPPPTPPTITRTIIAATKLQSVVEVPLYFRALSVTIPPGKKSSVVAASGILYQISGSTKVSVSGQSNTLSTGEGLFIAAGQTTNLEAGSSEPSTFLHFLLVSAADVNRRTEISQATVKELYHTPAPIPDLKSGSYDLNLTRVTFPTKMPSNPPHHRSGAALYYIISGTGATTVEGKTEERGPGYFIYEPLSLVHQWGNPGDAPFTFLAFNINPQGVAAVLPGAPVKE